MNNGSKNGTNRNCNDKNDDSTVWNDMPQIGNVRKIQRRRQGYVRETSYRDRKDTG